MGNLGQDADHPGQPARRLAGTHWDALRELLPAYRKITRVNVGDGRNTSSWYDVWLGELPLAEYFLALHSHFAGQASSILGVLSLPMA